MQLLPKVFGVQTFGLFVGKGCDFIPNLCHDDGEGLGPAVEFLLGFIQHGEKFMGGPHHVYRPGKMNGPGEAFQLVGDILQVLRLGASISPETTVGLLHALGKRLGIAPPEQGLGAGEPIQ
jgi:hypothetical protein